MPGPARRITSVEMLVSRGHQKVEFFDGVDTDLAHCFVTRLASKRAKHQIHHNKFFNRCAA